MKTLTYILLLLVTALPACKKPVDGIVVPQTNTSDAINLKTDLYGYKVNPTNSSAATGTLTGTLQNNTGQLEFKLNYSGMTPTEAHIHKGYFPDNGPVVYTIPIGATRLLTGNFTLTMEETNTLANGGYYVDIHSRAFEPGEIRGQIEKTQ